MIEIRLVFPTSINRRYADRSSKRLSDDYRTFKLLAEHEMRHLSPTERPVWVWLHLTHPRPRSFDCDNFVKAVQDAANGRVYRDDRQIDGLFVTRAKGTAASVLRVGYAGELPMQAIGTTVRSMMRRE